MENLQSTLIGVLQSSHPLFHGIAHGIAFYLIASLLYFSYRDHSYLYQKSDRSKMLDTWTNLLLPLARKVKFPKYRSSIATALGRSRLWRVFTVDSFIARQMLFDTGAIVISYVLLNLVLDLSIFLTIGFSFLAVALPLIKLNDLSNMRFKQINRDLAPFIDYLNLAMGAGLDFKAALVTVVGDNPNKAISEEFGMVLRNMRLGQGRDESLIEMERRIDSPIMKVFIQTLLQAMEMGNDVGKTLAVMSNTLQTKRFQLAEEMAGKISVRMMLPMMIFVLPSVMIILLGPMILSSPLFE